MKTIEILNLSVCGLQLPVALANAVQSSRPAFELCDSRDMAKIKCPRLNSVTGEVVPPEFVAKSIMVNKNRVMVPLSVLSDCAPAKQDVITFESFIDDYAIPLSLADYFYYLLPVKGWEENYFYVLECLAQYSLCGITNAVLQRVSSLLALVSADGVLCLHKLRYPMQIVPLEKFEKKAIDRQSVVYGALADGITKRVIPFDPSLYADSFTEKYNQWAKTHVNGEQ